MVAQVQQKSNSKLLWIGLLLFGAIILANSTDLLRENSHRKPCTTCKGTGKIVGQLVTITCPVCKGTGIQL